MQFFSDNHSRRIRSSLLYPLSVCLIWGIGLLIGSYLAGLLTQENLLMMRMLDVEHVSIVGVLLAQLLPLFISALLLRFFSCYSILPIVFLKAAIYSYVGCIFCLAFAEASWLVRSVATLSGSLSVPILLWYWFVAPMQKGSGNSLYIAAVTIALLGMIDFFMASPFWDAVL